jgi:Glycosyltransferase family 9 (heptosyltransferase)
LSLADDDCPRRPAIVVRSGALGDVLLLRRATATLNGAGFRIVLVAPGSSGAALVGPGPSEVACSLASERADLAALWACDAEPPRALREAAGEAAIAYAVSADPDLAANLSRLASRVILRSPAPPPGIHVSDWLAEPLASLGLDLAATVAPLEFTPAEQDAARPWRERLPERFLAIHPGSGSPRKNWPADSYAALAHDLALGEPFLAIRGPADQDAAAPLLRVPGAVIAECLPARTLGALLADAGVCIGNDSGVTHLAAAAGAPVLAIYGPTDPAQWAPIGRSVRTIRAEPIDVLSVADIAAAATYVVGARTSVPLIRR